MSDDGRELLVPTPSPETSPETTQPVEWVELTTPEEVEHFQKYFDALKKAGGISGTTTGTVHRPCPNQEDDRLVQLGKRLQEADNPSTQLGWNPIQSEEIWGYAPVIDLYKTWLPNSQRNGIHLRNGKRLLSDYQEYVFEKQNPSWHQLRNEPHYSSDCDTTCNTGAKYQNCGTPGCLAVPGGCFAVSCDC